MRKQCRRHVEVANLLAKISIPDPPGLSLKWERGEEKSLRPGIRHESDEEIAGKRLARVSERFS